MFTANFYRYLKRALFPTYYYQAQSLWGTKGYGIVNTKGEIENQTAYSSSTLNPINYMYLENRGGSNSGAPVSTGSSPLWRLYTASNNDYDTYGGLVFGTDNTPASINDYCLKGENITDKIELEVVNHKGYLNFEYGFDPINIYVFTNKDTENSITVGEIGIYKRYWEGARTDVMIWREALETPLVLQPGETGKIELTFEIKIPGEQEEGN